MKEDAYKEVDKKQCKGAMPARFKKMILLAKKMSSNEIPSVRRKQGLKKIYWNPPVIGSTNYSA